MYKGRRISVVIPCYNEEQGIRHVIQSLPKSVDEIVVVDNNSTDRTGEVAASLGAKVVLEKRKGYGAAYKAGLPAATGEVTVTMDGDGSYPTEQIEEVIDFLDAKNLDFVSASRFPLQNPEAMTFTNKLGNAVLTTAMFLLFGKAIKDSQSGMWVYKTGVYPLMRLTSDGMPFSEEIKIEAIRNGQIRFGEYHVKYHQRIGEVKLEKWRDGFKNLLFLLKKRFQ